MTDKVSNITKMITKILYYKCYKNFVQLMFLSEN